MKTSSLIKIAFFIIMFSSVSASSMGQTAKYVLVVHGGAGVILKQNMSAERESAYRAAITEALRSGFQVLKTGGSSLDAVEASVRVLEDSPLFNAGKGAVFTYEGKNELDAAIMDGKTLAAGAVAGVTTVKNPIRAARAVMDQSQHVLMVGAGADKFAKEAGLEIVDSAYFRTPERWNSLQKFLRDDSLKVSSEKLNKKSLKLGSANPDFKFGTVGAVAVDKQGNLAAGTSTGGMTGKRFGRVGDSPIIGAGTYANNWTAAISATGWGEFFIRNVVAYDISAMMEYEGLTVKAAAQAAIDKVGRLGGDGGVIALDRNGNAAMPFNTPGMFRGSVTSDGKIEVKIYKD